MVLDPWPGAFRSLWPRSGLPEVVSPKRSPPSHSRKPSNSCQWDVPGSAIDQCRSRGRVGNSRVYGLLRGSLRTFPKVSLRSCQDMRLLGLIFLGLRFGSR